MYNEPFKLEPQLNTEQICIIFLKVSVKKAIKEIVGSEREKKTRQLSLNATIHTQKKLCLWNSVGPFYSSGEKWQISNVATKVNARLPRGKYRGILCSFHLLKLCCLELTNVFLSSDSYFWKSLRSYLSCCNLRSRRKIFQLESPV